MIFVALGEVERHGRVTRRDAAYMKFPKPLAVDPTHVCRPVSNPVWRHRHPGMFAFVDTYPGVHVDDLEAVQVPGGGRGVHLKRTRADAIKKDYPSPSGL